MGHLLQIDGPTLPDGYNNVLYIFQFRELPQGTDQPLPPPGLETPPWKRKVFCLKDLHQCIDG